MKKWLALQNDVGRTFHELYVLEIDGVKQSEHRVFIEALKRGLELKRQCPRSDVKLRDAHENTNTTALPCPNERGVLVEDSPVHGPSKRVMDAFPG